MTAAQKIWVEHDWASVTADDRCIELHINQTTFCVRGLVRGLVYCLQIPSISSYPSHIVFCGLTNNVCSSDPIIEATPRLTNSLTTSKKTLLGQNSLDRRLYVSLRKTQLLVPETTLFGILTKPSFIQHDQYDAFI